MGRRNQPWLWLGAHIENCTSCSTSDSVGFTGLAEQQVFQRNDEIDPLSSLGWSRLNSAPIFHQRQWSRLQLQRAAQLTRRGRVQEWISRTSLLLCPSRKVF